MTQRRPWRYGHASLSDLFRPGKELRPPLRLSAGITRRDVV